MIFVVYFEDFLDIMDIVNIHQLFGTMVPLVDFVNIMDVVNIHQLFGPFLRFGKYCGASRVHLLFLTQLPPRI